nr:hypothetical protein [Tanacetum cinerariifolium]
MVQDSCGGKWWRVVGSSGLCESGRKWGEVVVEIVAGNQVGEEQCFQTCMTGVIVWYFYTQLVPGNKVKSRKARRRVRLIVSEDEDDLEDPSKPRRKIAQIDEDKGITLVQMGAQTQGRNEHKVESDFDFTTAEDISTANVLVTTAGVEISTATPEDKTAKTSDDSDDITLVETLIEIKKSATKSQKVKGVVFRDVEEIPRLIKSTTTLQPLPYIDLKDKGKGVLVEEEPMKVKRRDQGSAQIESDAELAQRLYEEEMGADHELAARLTYEEQEPFTVEERIKLLVEFFERRKKQLAAERIAIHMLIEKTYPLSQEMLSRMLNKRLEVDHESEMAFELLRFQRSQLKE